MPKCYTFSGPKYSTSRIADELPLELQLFLWSLVEQRAKQRADYLQVFDLSLVEDAGGQRLQRIVRSQEVPPYKSEYLVSFLAVTQEKVYVIDDGCVTMLFATER